MSWDKTDELAPRVAIVQLYQQGIATQEELAKLALQRNRLAHRYLNSRWQAIVAFVNTKPLISKLIAKILEREKE